MKRFLAWLFWRTFYLGRVQSRRKPLEVWFRRLDRTRWPWQKFKPHVWYNDDGNQWHVYFTDERCYVESRELRVKAYIGDDTGDIVGLTIYDETLRKPCPGSV